MEINIVDTTETAEIKLAILNKRMTRVFAYICFILLIFGLICLSAGLSSGYSHMTSSNGLTSYYNYHLGVGIGAGMLVTSAYLGLYILRLSNRMKKFSHGIIKYNFSDPGIKTSSHGIEVSLDWNTIKEIHIQKDGVLLATNNYSCPTLFILKSQISKDEINWLKNQIHKK